MLELTRQKPRILKFGEIPLYRPFFSRTPFVDKTLLFIKVIKNSPVDSTYFYETLVLLTEHINDDLINGRCWSDTKSEWDYEEAKFNVKPD